jgi:uncharacterized Zn finger protein (UPF0148 family)
MGYETLKNIIDFNKAQPSIEAEALAKNECPDCAYPLKVNSRGQKACPICERIYE